MTKHQCSTVRHGLTGEPQRLESRPTSSARTLSRKDLGVLREWIASAQERELQVESEVEALRAQALNLQETVEGLEQELISANDECELLRSKLNKTREALAQYSKYRSILNGLRKSKTYKTGVAVRESTSLFKILLLPAKIIKISRDKDEL